MGDYPFGGTPALQLQAATPVAGFALQNATPTILTWTPPNDGALHRFMVLSILHVTSNETGGAVGVNFTLPDGTASGTIQLFGSGLAAGARFPATNQWVCQAGQAVTLVQQQALSGGAATVWAEIWGS